MDHFPNPYDAIEEVEKTSALSQHSPPPPSRAQTQPNTSQEATQFHLPARANSVPSSNIPHHLRQQDSPKFIGTPNLTAPPNYAVPVIARPPPGAHGYVPYDLPDSGKSDFTHHEEYMMKHENKTFSDLDAAVIDSLPSHLRGPGAKKAERTCCVKFMRCLACCWFWEALWALLRILMCCCIWESIGCCGKRAKYNGGAGIDAGGIMV
ncbi:hypothetical protein DL96DRAFT_1596547 [Flagelloscypha sp. PMI_526]|nr:hypothetical protein DL96DRAFT_1596547 [Flagelloscypha sp. PMI_526]